jgi:2-oxoglutarate dehydrogenase E2 component (dihydrolipoamide succinyltransferase)
MMANKSSLTNKSSLQIVVPALGESVLEATVSQWLKQEGERVAVGEALVELETDKVNVEVGAERSGVLAKIERAAGEDVRVGEVLGVIDEAVETAEAPAGDTMPVAKAFPPDAGERLGEAKHSIAKEAEAGGKGHLESERRSEERIPSAEEKGAPQKDGQPAQTPAYEAPAGAAPTGPASAERATPVAQRVAQELNVDLSKVQGTGPGGRVTRENVEQYAGKPPLQQAPPASQPPREQARTETSTQQVDAVESSAPPHLQRQAPVAAAPVPGADRREERVKMSRRRRTIAQRLVEAQQTAAMLTTFNEIDMGAVMDLRKRRNEAFQARHGVKLGFTSFFVKASIGALKAFPRLNAEIQGEGHGDMHIILKHYYDIGVAIGASEGLVVPVLRNADRMSFAQIEQKVKDFARQAEEGSLTIEDLRGGTFSITNGGVYGSLLSTPILNPPQVGILGLHKIEPRPVIVNNEVAARSMMYVALTYDHRIVDGREAVQFLVRVKELIEDPESLLIEG